MQQGLCAPIESKFQLLSTFQSLALAIAYTFSLFNVEFDTTSGKWTAIVFDTTFVII